MSVLQVTDISVTIGDTSLLDGVNLTIEPGQIVSIIGPNGAGKSTLLRAICGDVAHTRGKVSLNGQPIDAISPRDRARHLAVLEQNNSLDFAFTGLEVVSLSRTPHATGHAIDAAVCLAAMNALDVAHLADRPYPQLSGGEQQRLHLARVLAQIWREEDAGQRLLLLDEPVTSLDIGHQWQCMQAVREFAAQGVAVLMILHDMTLAGAFSDRIIAINQGLCCAQGTPEQVLTSELIERVFNTRVCILPHPASGKPVVINA